MSFKGESKKRPVRYEGEKLVSRHYKLSDKIHIELIKIATIDNTNVSDVVRTGLKEYINKRNLKNTL